MIASDTRENGATVSLSKPLKTTLIAGIAVVLAALIVGGIHLARTNSNNAPKGDVILNMFQWNWESVARECTDYIGPAGFGYVQVSPPNETITGKPWWTSYQPVSYKLEGKLGTREQFVAMVDTCEKAGVGVVVDAVINHMAAVDNAPGVGIAGSAFDVDDFPGIWTAEDFNECREGIINWQDKDQVQHCRLLGLQDLRTGSVPVQQTLADYLNELIDIGVKGFRIDAAKHIPTEDLHAILELQSDPDVFWIQEVIRAHGEPITPEEYTPNGMVHEFQYGRDLRDLFTNRIKYLPGFEAGMLPSESAGTFVDNHDTERNGDTMSFASGEDYILANAVLLSYPYGHPSVFTGYTFDDVDAGAPGATDTSVPAVDCDESEWTCLQRDPRIVGLVQFYNTVQDEVLVDWWDNDENLIGYGRGSKGFIVINNEDESQAQTFQSSLPAGNYCSPSATDLCGRVIQVAPDGTFTAEIPSNDFLVLQVNARQ